MLSFSEKYILTLFIKLPPFQSQDTTEKKTGYFLLNLK